MHGVRRVIIFCALTALLPILLVGMPLYLRHYIFADLAYAVPESEIFEMTDGISSIFCSAHTLKANGSFNAFQMDHRPERTRKRKHIQLKKSMSLPDDTLEYWGFYLLREATVALSVCSRFPGASILVVKGGRSFSTCGMLDHNEKKARALGMYVPHANEQVKITFESNAQIIDFEEANQAVTSPRNLSPADKRGRKLGRRKEQKMEDKMKKKQIEERIEEEEKEELVKLETMAKSYLEKHIKEEPKRNVTRKSRHTKKHHRRLKIHSTNDESIRQKIPELSERRARGVDEKIPPDRRSKLNSLQKELAATDEEIPEIIDSSESPMYKVNRKKRNNGEDRAENPWPVLDHGIQHGGNALKNASEEESSISSFEEGLFQCYGEQVLLAQEFEPSELCTNVSHLVNGKYMQSIHDVTEDGYYYYIFYSDNDIDVNDIHALFDIFKPTFQYENVTNSCVNKTECTFPLTMFSNDRVIVEIPTKDGIDHEQDDILLLVSICRPRTGIYIIFPIALLFIILTCAFM